MSEAENTVRPGVTYPALALRGLVVFPGMLLQFDVGRKKSVLAVQKAMEGDQLIFLVTQTSLSENEPTADDLYKVGVVARVKQLVRHGDDELKIFVEGVCRAEVNRLVFEEPYLRAEVTPFSSLNYRASNRTEALQRYIQNLFESYIRTSKHVPPDIILGVLEKKDCGELADFIAANVPLDFEAKQCILDELHPVKRLKKLAEILEDEIEVAQIENEITEKARAAMDDSQRSYFLHEQMKAIAEELGEDDNPAEEAEELRRRVTELHLAKETEEKLLKECDRFAKMPYGSHEGAVLRSYIETCLELPWNKESRVKIDLSRARNVLDKGHYGLEKVKERILETLAVRKLAPETTPQIICLVGPPGVGKTSIARSIAEATGRKYVRISLGGVHDEADIVGHRRTYVGSMPGRIIAGIRQAGVNNPLLLLDEVDKLGKDFKGDPAAALLEVLDPDQNSTFHDHYIDLPFDLSRVMFITTANDASAIPGPLYDRMDVITLGSYTAEEKFHIATRHLIPRQLKAAGIQPQQLKFTPAAVRGIIDGYTREAGVRTLERTIATVCRKTAAKIVSDPDFEKYTVKPENLEELLGPCKYKDDTASKKDEVGLVNGLAWTSVGGELLPIEVAVMDGTGKIELTGSLGDVMKESARTAITCIRTRAETLGISPDFYAKKDIHIHAPEGAVPKDGPSAGIAMATAVTSALTGIPVRHTIAMTGEITLQGRVLPIGGLRGKAMAAYKHGIRTVLIPAENEPDLAEVDEVVKKNVSFVPVERIDKVLPLALAHMPQPAPSRDPHYICPQTAVPEICGTAGKV